MEGVSFNKKGILEKLDATPTAGSTNGVQSGGVKTYVDGKDTQVRTDFAAADNVLDGKITQTQTDYQAADAVLDGRITDALNQITNPFNFKGTVAAVANLPASGNTINDTYYVEAENCSYSWNGTAWSKSSAVRSDMTGVLADAYSATKTYAVGDIVMYQDKAYICKTAITTAEAWTAAHWTEQSLGTDIANVNNALNDRLKNVIGLNYSMPVNDSQLGGTGRCPIEFDCLYVVTNYGGTAVAFFDSSGTQLTDLNIPASGRLETTIDFTDSKYSSCAFFQVNLYGASFQYTVFAYNKNDIQHTVEGKIDGIEGWYDSPKNNHRPNYLNSGQVGRRISAMSYPEGDNIECDVSGVDKIRVSGYSWDLSYQFALWIFTTASYTVISKCENFGYFQDVEVEVPSGAKYVYVNGTDMYPASVKIRQSITDGELAFDLLSSDYRYKYKSFLLLGDSITQLGITARGWPTYFNKVVAPSRMDNLAVIGAHWCDYNDHTTYDGNPTSAPNEQNVIGNQIQKIINNRSSYAEDYDYIFIAAGTNDGSDTDVLSIADIDSAYFENDDIKPLSSVDRSTWAGITRYAVEKLQELFPSAKIIFCTPIHRIAGYTSQTVINVGKILCQCSNAASVYLCDVQQCGIRMYDHTCFNDDLHTSTKGAMLMGEYISKWFISTFYA